MFMIVPWLADVEGEAGMSVRDTSAGGVLPDADAESEVDQRADDSDCDGRLHCSSLVARLS